MSADAAGSAMGFVTALKSASAGWPDELWAGSVAWADGILRSYYGIYEFTDDPSCVLRVGLGQARAPVSLSDGTDVRVGELIGTLHFWNEHLPRYSARGPDLGWACAVRDRGQIFASRLIRVYRGRASLAERTRDSYRDRFARTARRLPAHARLSAIPTDPSLRARLHGLGECFVLWGLTRAFNPAALPRQPFLRDRHELWISRAALRWRYSRRNRQIAIGAARRRGA